MKPSNAMIKGFSLIEILITLVITAIGLLGLASLQLQSMKTESNSLSRSQAIFIANDIANRIYINKSIAASYLTPETGINCTDFSQPDLNCSDYSTSTGNSNQDSQSCPAQQDMASFDIWDVLCGEQINQAIRNHSGNYMAAQSVTISCNGQFAPNICNSPADLNINISWINKARSDQQAGNNTLNTERLNYSLEIRL